MWGAYLFFRAPFFNWWIYIDGEKAVFSRAAVFVGGFRFKKRGHPKKNRNSGLAVGRFHRGAAPLVSWVRAARHGVAVANGTAALDIAVKASGAERVAGGG